MKKIIVYICWIAAMMLQLTSCNKDLNVSPQNILGDDDLYSNESAVIAYFATLYNDLPIEDFNYSTNGFNTWPVGGGFLYNFTDEGVTNLTDNWSNIGGGTSLGYWAYGAVRNINDFIAKIPASGFADEQKNLWLGEAKFIRAYYYFGMVKRYGGVPLITAVQNYTGNNLEELKVGRNTEKEIYDFVASELDAAIDLLNETSDAGRANKYVAYALKSRAMLYAASIAKYGSVQLNGLVGIASSDANTYWQAAYNAAKKVIDAGKYSLYSKSSDKTENYINLFLDDASSENILIKRFSYPSKAHSYDNWNLPYSQRGTAGYGSRSNPSLELVSAYEYVDGTAGTLKLNNGGGTPIEYTNPIDLFTGKDPRLAATVIYPFATWKGNVIDVHAGLIDGAQTITAGDYNTLYNGMHVIGNNGIGGGGGEVSQTGFYIRKYLNPSYDRSTVAPWTSSQSFIDFRYAEVLLNYAEAAAELGKSTDAAWALNEIRTRAGIKTVTEAEATINKVRHERQVELAFENHRYWDMRRWRIADQLLNNTKLDALLPYFVIRDNAYIFKTTGVGWPKTFTPNMYYERINPDEISKNSKLIQNPGY
ncbi:MAG: RagB/SusD family nutrient uptake outer membrane protein [Agriterribacter sp.]